MKIALPRITMTILLMVCFVVFGHSQQAETSKVIGHLIRVTPRLSDIDNTTMYGQPLKITRRGDGFAGGIVNPEKAEEKIFRRLPNNDISVSNPGGGALPGPDAPSGLINYNFDGQTATGFAPSDNNLAVGPNHVVQMINYSSGSIFKIWDKSGNVLKNSTVLSSLTGVTGAGDPVVLYDQLADKWVLTEFGYSNGVTTYINTLIMAVSKTNDPTGQYNVYSYNIGSFFVDYPKYSIWQNAYYATSNDFNTAGTSYLGSSMYAFDRNAMITGAATATMIRTRFSGSGDRYYSMAPVCQEGLTGSNQNGLIALIQDNAWISGVPTDSILIAEYTPNFAAGTATTTFRAMGCTLPLNTTVGNLAQKGTTGTIQSLDSRLMNKVIYRNFGSYESIVCNTVDLQSSRAGIHWWELRRTGGAGNYSIYQEGLYQPSGDTHNRFMGSIDINANGTIGLLFNISSSTIYPSAHFTARSACDPLGQMTMPETVIKDGTTYEASNNRYGDYNALCTDPANGPFWGTAQYNATGFGTYGNWVTRVMNISLSSNCGNPGTVSGTSPICFNQTAQYSSNGDAGGTWSSSNTSVATVNASSGLVTGAAAGTTNITYTVNGSSASKLLTVNGNPIAGIISGTNTVCTGANVTLTSNGDVGGTWSSDNTAVATVNSSSGVVTGVSAGTANISYTVTNSCGSASSAPYAVSVTVCLSPSLTCPSNISSSLTSGCNKSIAVPNATTNATTLTWVMSGATTGSSGSTGINFVGTKTFNIGVTTITYTANSGGPSATCSFTVTVVDNSPALITCPANISTTLNRNGKCSTSINTANPNTSGNCTVSKLTWSMTGAVTASSPSTGINYVGTKTFPVGITTVTYNITNGAGTTGTCSFTVTVRNSRCPGSPAAPVTNGDKTDAANVKAFGTDLKVSILPNPSESYFTLRLLTGGNEDLDISVYNIAGKLMQKLNGNAYQVFRFGNDYTSGTYVVVIRQGAKQTTIKVVK